MVVCARPRVNRRARTTQQTTLACTKFNRPHGRLHVSQPCSDGRSRFGPFHGPWIGHGRFDLARRQRLENLAISTVNDHIQGDLEVAYVELSWWNGFPNISVDLKQVALTSASGDTLLEAKRVGVELSFWSLWGDHPRVHAVRLEDGQMTVLQDPSGQWKLMDVLSPSSRTSEHDGDGSGFTLDEVQFHNIQTSGVLSDGTDFRLLLDDASVDIHADTPDIHWALTPATSNWRLPNFPHSSCSTPNAPAPCSKNQDATWAVASEVVVEGISAALTASVDAEERWTGRIRVPSVSMRQLERVVHDVP